MGRTILIGDVHGCADEMGDLLDAVQYAQGSDRLVLVGDLVARGPDSGAAVARAIDSGADAVRGNHDEKLLAFWRVARDHGPRVAATHVRLSERHRIAYGQLREEHFDWLESRPLMLALPSHAVMVAHAGLDPSVALDEQQPAMVMNIRSIDDDGAPSARLEGTPWARLWRGPPHIVFGHDARRSIQLERDATGLDSGCCYGRELTALVLDHDEAVPSDPRERRARLISVPARAVHCPMGDGRGPE